MRDSYNKYLGTRINQLVSIAVNGGVANLYAQVKDLAGVNLIVPGETVTFTVNDPLLGTLSAVTLTNGAGVATANFTSGATLGTAIINASVTNHSAVTFTSTATVTIITPGFIAGRVTNVTSGAAIAQSAAVTVTSGATTIQNFLLVTTPVGVKGDVNPITGLDVGDVLFVAQAVANLRTL